MKKNAVRSLCALLARALSFSFFVFAIPAWALDLSEAYQIALEQDATIRAARAATDARRERLPQARSQLLPNVSISASRYRNSLDRTSPDFFGNPVSSREMYTSSSEALTLRQPIYRKYQMADYQQAYAQVIDANATLERELQNVAVRTSSAYFEALLTEEQLALVLAQKITYTTQFDAAGKRFQAGAGTRTEIDEARAALDLNLAQELEARQSKDLAQRQLQSLINRPVGRLALLDPTRMLLVPPVPGRVEDWIELAEVRSPELQSLKAQVEAAGHEIGKAQAGHYPTLDAVAQVARNDSDTVNNINSRYTSKFVGLQLNIPVFSGGYVSSTVRQSFALKERADESLEALRRDLSVRLHREFRGVTEGVLRVKALEQAVLSAQQAVLSTRRSFDAGSRTLPDVLNAEQKKVSAQRDLVEARFVYLLSRVRLNALAGGSKGEVIDEINTWLIR
ncbi:MAG: type secretion outer membrane protein TolC family [Herminiimonas sp.]|nr:type secretion outer membrane protein TolC family [Herminiimonas sp.]MDB5854336.1 type secretion outer membrane protein TolC family [Herminiimonas sp.]